MLTPVLHTYPNLGFSLFYLLPCTVEPLPVSEGEKPPEQTVRYSSTHSPTAPSLAGRHNSNSSNNGR